MEVDLNEKKYQQLLSTIQQRKVQLDARLQQLRQKEEALKKSTGFKQPEPLLYLDVGGQEYHTTFTTLTKYPGSRLEVRPERPDLFH